MSKIVIDYGGFHTCPMEPIAGTDHFVACRWSPVCDRTCRKSYHHETQNIIEEREHTHGNYLHQSTLAQELKRSFRDRSAAWKALSPEQRETLDMIAVKISRILTGNPNEADHYRDIAGYSTLIVNLLETGDYLGRRS